MWEQTGGGPYAAVRPAASGIWQAPVDLAPANHETAYPSQVAVDPRGDAIVAWSSGGVIQAAVRRGEDGGWLPPATISQPNSPANVAVEDPEVALDDQGEAVVVWDRTIRQSKGEGISTVQAATDFDRKWCLAGAGRTKAGGSAGSSTAEEGAEGSGILREQRRLGMTLPEVAIDARGDAVATWTDTGPDSSAVQASTRPAEGTWQSPIERFTPWRTAHGGETCAGRAGPRGLCLVRRRRHRSHDAPALWQLARTSGHLSRRRRSRERPTTRDQHPRRHDCHLGRTGGIRVQRNRTTAERASPRAQHLRSQPGAHTLSRGTAGRRGSALGRQNTALDRRSAARRVSNKHRTVGGSQGDHHSRTCRARLASR